MLRLLIILNGGVSNARNELLKHSTGNYILFVDSDDFCDKEMVSLMVEKLKTEDSDIVICDFYNEYSDRRVSVRFAYKDKDSYLREMIRSQWAVVWNKLIRRDLFIKNSINFPKDINGGEDYCAIVSVSYYATVVSFVSKCLYHHVNYNMQSIMKSPSYNNMYEQVLASVVMDRFFQSKSDRTNYVRELNQRKLHSKNALLLYAIQQWNMTFREANEACFYYKCNWRQKLKYILLDLFCRIFK